MKLNQWTINNARYGEFGKLTEYEGVELELLTLEELQNLKKISPKTELLNIFGIEYLAEDADEDIRYGYVAYGLNKAK